MPADLNIQTEIDAMNSTTGGATTWAIRVTAVLVKAFDAIVGVFGTAATRNVGTGGGELPQLLANGKLPQSTLPLANEDFKGTVLIATDINDTRGNAVPTIGIIRDEIINHLPEANFQIGSVQTVDMSIPNARSDGSTVQMTFGRQSAQDLSILSGLVVVPVALIP